MQKQMLHVFTFFFKTSSLYSGNQCNGVIYYTECMISINVIMWNISIIHSFLSQLLFFSPSPNKDPNLSHCPF